MRLSVVLSILLLCGSSLLTAAELKLAAVFSDHMVLQRGKSVPVWGQADAGEEISVEFAGQKQVVKAGENGRWMVKLEPLTASTDPRVLVARSAKPGRSIEVSDVLVGEVWLGSGQSNMAMTVNRALDYEAEQTGAKWPLIRMFKEESGAARVVQPDGKGRWAVCAPETVGGFSATLYFFGREVHRELNVPVGLINSSVGGTPIESWIAEEAQARTPELKTDLAAQARTESAFDIEQAKAQHAQALARWQKLAASAKAAGKPAPRKPVDPVEQRQRRGGYGGLFNGKIHPLIPYAVRGILWYQGEANSRPGKGDLYQYQLPLLVSDWRARWGEELPFAWVQLPNFDRDGEDWLLVREAMLKTLRLPRTGMAITIDIGEAKDIHPRNKQEVGRRLALWALGTVYEKKVPATSGPLPAGHEVRGSEVVVKFQHAAGGLKTHDGESVRGFAISGADGQWHPASARIDGETAVISSTAVKQPVAVRYAWAANPDCNLINTAGLPASPFRTDP